MKSPSPNFDLMTHERKAFFELATEIYKTFLMYKDAGRPRDLARLRYLFETLALELEIEPTYRGQEELKKSWQPKQDGVV